MKHTFLCRSSMALFLVTAMLLGLAACGNTEAAAQPSASVNSIGTADSLTPSVGTISNRMSLDELRAKATRENEYATIVAAYLGDRASLTGVGFEPTDNATEANYNIFADIDKAHRIDLSNGADDAELYCLFPVDPTHGMFVTLVDEQGNEKKEVYNSKTGEPILLSCNGGGTQNAKVCFTNGQDVETFWPMTTVSCGQRYLMLGNGGMEYDFTIYPSQPVGDPIQAPGGTWQAEVLDPNNNFESITMVLNLSTDYGWANLTISDTRSGDVMVEYSGMCMEVDDEHFLLDLTCDENCTGISAYDTPIHGEYLYSVGSDFSLTVSVSGTNGTPFYENHAHEPISFYPYKALDIEVGDSANEPYCIAVLNYYDTTFGYRPGCATAEPSEGNDLLIHLFDNMGDHVTTCGWYTINPDTLQGCDYMTGEMIDFSDYTDAVG